MMDQIQHCANQLERFAKMHMENNIDSPERTLQFGYNFGRLVVLLEFVHVVYGYRSILHAYTSCMANTLISKFNFDSSKQGMIDYGFAIGFLQEVSGESHEKWWKPVAEAAKVKNWKEVENITRQNLKNLYIDKCESFYFNVLDKSKKIKWKSVLSDIVKANVEITEKLSSFDYIN